MPFPLRSLGERAILRDSGEGAFVPVVITGATPCETVMEESVRNVGEVDRKETSVLHISLTK